MSWDRNALYHKWIHYEQLSLLLCPTTWFIFWMQVCFKILMRWIHCLSWCRIITTKRFQLINVSIHMCLITYMNTLWATLVVYLSSYQMIHLIGAKMFWNANVLGSIAKSSNLNLWVKTGGICISWEHRPARFCHDRSNCVRPHQHGGLEASNPLVDRLPSIPSGSIILVHSSPSHVWAPLPSLYLCLQNGNIII